MEMSLNQLIISAVLIIIFSKLAAIVATSTKALQDIQCTTISVKNNVYKLNTACF